MADKLEKHLYFHQVVKNIVRKNLLIISPFNYWCKKKRYVLQFDTICSATDTSGRCALYLEIRSECWLSSETEMESSVLQPHHFNSALRIHFILQPNNLRSHTSYPSFHRLPTPSSPPWQCCASTRSSCRRPSAPCGGSGSGQAPEGPRSRTLPLRRDRREGRATLVFISGVRTQGLAD